VVLPTLAALLIAAPAPQKDSPQCTPPGVLRERTTDEAKEKWCETPDGVRHGPRWAWYNSGQAWFIGEYDYGGRTGTWRFWYPGGQPMSTGAYRKDKRHGTSKHFGESGTMSMAGACIDGVEDGLWTRWYPNGKKELEVVFQKGKPGKRTYYSRRGRAVPFEDWVAEKVRGAVKGSARYEAARKRYAKENPFVECGN